MKVQVLEHGFELHKGTESASGFDIRNTFDDLSIVKGKVTKVGLGIKTEVPEGFVAVIAPRSGLGSKGIQVCNTMGFIDTDYRGEWMAHLTLADWSKETEMLFKRGDRILQVFIVPVLTQVEYVTELSETARGEGGFGSSGVE